MDISTGYWLNSSTEHWLNSSTEYWPNSVLTQPCCGPSVETDQLHLHQAAAAVAAATHCIMATSLTAYPLVDELYYVVFNPASRFAQLDQQQ